MADNKNPNEKKPGEKPEGKYHYNPGNQSGEMAGNVPKEELEKDKKPPSAGKRKKPSSAEKR
jgi:hypothetical protein